MRTSKEERADLRARCRAGVIAITTDAALVAALIDDVEELDALVDAGARAVSQMAQDAAAEVDRLRGELAERDVVDRCVYLSAVETIGRVAAERDEARAERDARPEITASVAALMCSPLSARTIVEEQTAAAGFATLRAHAGKVAR